MSFNQSSAFIFAPFIKALAFRAYHSSIQELHFVFFFFLRVSLFIAESVKTHPPRQKGGNCGSGEQREKCNADYYFYLVTTFVNDFRVI